ncbi:hypothetical protein Y026_4511 [Burkholderia pseudomallei TSV28]|nr:hypothetical protein Y026_4511 [Burkholderia pseudomallei TSV28]
MLYHNADRIVCLSFGKRRIVACVARLFQTLPFNGRSSDRQRGPFADFDLSHAPVDGRLVTVNPTATRCRRLEPEPRTAVDFQVCTG